MHIIIVKLSVDRWTALDANYIIMETTWYMKTARVSISVTSNYLANLQCQLLIVNNIFCEPNLKSNYNAQLDDSTNGIHASIKKIKNSLILHQEKANEITAASVVLYLIKNHVQYMYINFNFFLGLENVHF
jgi:hypothetical protein